jgi:hypothetical protein
MQEEEMSVSRRNAILGAAAIGGATLVATVAEAQERHPKIREAIRAIQGARDDLTHAAHDFGGHRDDALHACDEAVRQLRICLNYP